MKVSKTMAASSLGKDYHLMIIDKDGTILFANTYLANTLHREGNTITESSIFDFLSPQFQAAFKKVLDHSSNPSLQSSIDLSLKNGIFHDVRWEVSKLLSPSASVDKYLCIGNDIIPGDHNKEYIDKGKILNQLVIDKLNIGFIVQDAHGKVINVNQKAAEILDTTSENLYSQNGFENLWATIRHKDYPVSFANIPPMKALKTGKAQSNVIVDIKTAENEGKSLLFNSQPLFNPYQSKPFAIVSSFVIISTEKKDEIKMISSRRGISKIKQLNGRSTEVKPRYNKEITEAVIRLQENERTYIGHELHDNVNQILASARIYLDLLKPEDENQINIKNKISCFLLMATEEIRTLSKRLVTPRLEDSGLVGSIAGLIDDIRNTNLFNIKFTTCNNNDIEQLAQDKKITLFRIVQEQMNNIIKHSLAENVEICLLNSNTGIQLSIHDDGTGFDHQKTKKGIGLSNIFDRVKLFGGSMDLKAAPGRGCLLTVAISADKVEC